MRLKNRQQWKGTFSFIKTTEYGLIQEKKKKLSSLFDVTERAQSHVKIKLHRNSMNTSSATSSISITIKTFIQVHCGFYCMTSKSLSREFLSSFFAREISSLNFQNREIFN
jgi:hypothetical protein